MESCYIISQHHIRGDSHISGGIMEQNNQKDVALAIGTLLMGSGYEKLFTALAAIKEENFIGTDTAVKDSDTVLGPMSRLEKAAHTFSSNIQEMLEEKGVELGKYVCPTCPVDKDCGSPNAPCRDLNAQRDLAVKAQEILWDSIRLRFDNIPSVGIRSGFIAVKCPSKAPRISVEIISVDTSSSPLGGLASKLFGKMGFSGR